MALLTPESARQSTLGHLIYSFEWRKYAPFAIPSTKNLFKVFDTLRSKKVDMDLHDEEGNHIEINQTTPEHYFTGGPHWFTKGVRVAIRQKLPEDRVQGEKYLSIIMSRDEKEDIRFATCVVVPTTTIDEEHEYGKYKRIGDLRMDYLHPNGKFENGGVDGNDDGLGIPTGEWFIDGQNFDNSITRAYLLLVNRLFGVGEIPPLGSKRDVQVRRLLEEKNNF